MKWALLLLAAVSSFIGFTLLGLGRLEILSVMLLLISAVLLCGAGIVEAIEVHATKMEQLLKALTKTRDVKDE